MQAVDTRETPVWIQPDAPQPRILVVDDNVGLADLWRFTLEDTGYEVGTAASVGEALEAVSRDRYNAAVLDLQLPDGSGLDVLAALRARVPDAEGILITGHASPESTVNAVQQGIYGYLLKPVDAEILRMTVERAVERQQLRREREDQRRQLEIAYRRERHIAETLQQALLPPLHLDAPGIRAAYVYQAAMAEAEVGGDFYDVVVFPDGRVGVLLGDVSGKGLDAAVYTALTKYTLRGYALEDPDPGRVLKRLNRAFYLQSREETFATLFFAVLDLVPGRLTYASAGHEPGLLHRPHSGITEWLHSTGPAAGVLPDAEYGSMDIEFSDHDLLFLYTDGASDARRGKEWLGTEGLVELLGRSIQPDVQDTLAGILDGILHFACQQVGDDMALLLLGRKPEELGATADRG